MPKLKLTKTSIAELKADSKVTDYFDTEVNGLTLRVFPSGAQAFSIIYRNNEGKQRRYTIGKYPSIPLAQAKKEAQRLLLLISQGEDVQQLKVVSKRVIQGDVFTFRKYLDSFYLEWYKQNRKSHQGVKNILINCCTPLHEIKLIDIDKPKVNKFLYQYVSNHKVGNASFNRILSAVKGAVTKAVEFGYLDENKLAGFTQQTESVNKIRYLSEAEKKRLFQALDLTELLLKHIVLVAYYTGMRRGEIFSLHWEDIDLKTNQITLDRTRTKSGKNRSIPMHSNVRNLLLELNCRGQKSGLIFKSPVTGNRLDNVKKSWTTLMKKAEIENFRFHDLRHNFASQLVMKGESLSVVRELLGHSDFKMTLRYAHLAPEHKQKAVDLL